MDDGAPRHREGRLHWLDGHRPERDGYRRPTLKHLTLELSGNDAAIVMPDVDVAKTARKLFMGAFLNSGQVCVAAKRIYVHDAIYDAFARPLPPRPRPRRWARARRRASCWARCRTGERVKELIAATRDAGHTFLAGGYVPEGWATSFHRQSSTTRPMTPASWSRSPSARSFRCCVSPTSTRWYGAPTTPSSASGARSGRTTSRRRGLGARLETGTVWINSVQLLDPLSPFAGRKQSGISVENGVEGLLEFTAIQTMVG